MKTLGWKHKIPGMVATGLLALTTSLWTFWGAAEMYYEGWGLPFPKPLAYLIPGAACLALSLLVLTWPGVAGWLLIGAGGGFTVWWWTMTARRAGQLTLSMILSMFPVSGLLIVVGVLFLFEGRYRRRRRAAGIERHPNGWLRNLHYLIGIGAPLLTLLGISAFQLPHVLARVDDGISSARLIQGNGVRLIWAPAGPGWNWQQPGGWNPSWNHIALYGASPAGLKNRPPQAAQADMDAQSICAHLADDGITLMDEPQGIWRMPTVDELVRSLVRRGENAGCAWNGEDGRAECRVEPDKETPLWSGSQSAIYYWTADEYDAQDAWYVSYNGWVHHQPKGWGNSRHGHRCVRAP